MKKISIFFILSIFLVLTIQAQNNIQDPKSFFGFTPGDDSQLFNYEQMIEYFKILDSSSSKLKLEEIGISPLGKKIYIAFISSEKNISNLKRLQEINKELALNPNLSSEELNKLTEEGKVFILATLSMHSTEVGPSQSAPLIAYNLITSNNRRIVKNLNNVVYMMLPCHNPDGMDMVVENYLKYRNTKYDGASLPRVYHKYVGHDNNRDFVTLTQSDTKAISKITSSTWFPQVMIEKHQMGKTGVRYFVPPMHDPIAENVDEGLWNWINIFGANLITDLTNDGCSGVTQHNLFDNYWPGSTETCLWKNVIAMLSEAASVNTATPIYVEPSELRVSGKGLAEYKKSINMPLPWPGGWWRLSDIVKLEYSSTLSLINTASLRKNDILRFRNNICKKEIQKGKSSAPYYFHLPINQHDQSELIDLVNLLNEHGIKVYSAKEDFESGNIRIKTNDIIVPLAQPFRAFLKEVLEKQKYPERHYTRNGKLIMPYDITSWSLPLHRGIECNEINSRFISLESQLQLIKKLNINSDLNYLNSKYLVFNVCNNESYKAMFFALKKKLPVYRIFKSENYKDGSFVIETDNTFNKFVQTLNIKPNGISSLNNLIVKKIKAPKIGLIETYFHDMDAGWTRYIFDTYHIKYTVINPPEIKKLDLTKYDILIFPDANKNLLLYGKYKSQSGYSPSSYPPEFAKGMENKGLEKIIKFINRGGIVLSWKQSTSMFTGTHKIKKDNTFDEFRFPFYDVSSSLRQKGLNITGSLIKIKLKKNTLLTLGMPETIGVFHRSSPVFSTTLPRFDTDRRIIGFFPEDENLLLSGYANNAKLLENKAAIIWLKKGKGQLIVYSFNPEFRASTQGSFKLVFNALLLPKNYTCK